MGVFKNIGRSLRPRGRVSWKHSANWVVLEGHIALQRKIANLGSPATQRRIIRPAVTQALAPINKAAKRKAPVETGLLKKSIGKKVAVVRRTGDIWGGVGIRKGFKQEVTVDGKTEMRNPINYAHLVEFGTKNQPAKPFLRPALDEKRPEAMRILARVVKERLHKEAAKRQ